MPIRNPRILFAAGLLLASGVLYFSGATDFITFEALKQHQEELRAGFDHNPFAYGAGYFLSYVLVSALSIPVAAVLSLAGGAVLGLFWGSVLASFASTIGAAAAFLSARYIFKGAVDRWLGDRLALVQEGIRREGAFYLFMLRLIPIFPFWAINVAMGVTSIRTLRFYWVSQFGMLPGTLIYVNAGTQLATVEKPSDLLTPAVLTSLALIAIFPLVLKKLLSASKGS